MLEKLLYYKPEFETWLLRSCDHPLTMGIGPGGHVCNECGATVSTVRQEELIFELRRHNLIGKMLHS